MVNTYILKTLPFVFRAIFTSRKIIIYNDVYIPYSLAYSPSFSKSSLCVPVSDIPSSVRTIIFVAFLIVVNLCAIVNVVLPLASLSNYF